MGIDKVIQEVKDNVLSNFDLKEILEFTLRHRVEVMVGEDHQYYCYIDYQLNKRAFSIEVNPLECIMNGINQYKEQFKTTDFS